MGPDSGMVLSTAIRGRMTPRFFLGGGGGVALVSAFLPRPKRAGRLTGDNHSVMREIDECGCGTPKPEILVHPPL